MSQQQKLEKVLDLLLSEDSDQASELLHQIIVEKARNIYESIVDEESVDDEDEDLTEAEDEVGGEANDDFTADIASDADDVDTDEINDGEVDDAEDEEEDEMNDVEDEEEDVEDRVEDLESQLAELRAEFDALMGEEMQEPNHSDLGDVEAGIENEFDGEDEFADTEPADDEMPDMGDDETVVGEVVTRMYEKQAKKKLPVAPQTKKTVKGKRADEETQFLNKVADTGQKGTAKLVGTGKNTPLGAEQNQSPYTHAPTRKDYGGTAKNILGGKGTGGEYGKYNGDSAKDDTPSDNVKVDPKNSSIKADTTAKYTGGKTAGPGFTKSPLTKKPS